MKSVRGDNGTRGAADLCGACGMNARKKMGMRPHGGSPSLMTPPSGFGRTLSTELLAKQEKVQTLFKITSLLDCRTYSPGEVIIPQGDPGRDLFLLTEGRAEVSTTTTPAGTMVLAEIGAPYILGEIACLLGIPRTATITAKTTVTVFVLLYDTLQESIGEFPYWFPPLLSSFVSGLKSLNNTISNLEQEVEQLRRQLADKKR
ncbi:MAG: cyclic nucleotide-binding domain-containing protein [Desulfobacterales bacterium]|nr:cyclic nucleotide-binding domain-containing protein [Desulfobacterales bacterium]